MKVENQPVKPKLSRDEIFDQIVEKDTDGDFKFTFIPETVTGPDGNEHNIIHFVNPHAEDRVIISIPSRASMEDILAIRNRILAIPEACETLVALAEAYTMRQPILIEGGTAIGKTFAVNKFTELLYGKRIKPLDFYCSGHTDVSELMGKWIPRFENVAEQIAWKTFIESTEGAARISNVHTQATALPETLQRDALKAGLKQLASEIGLGGTTSWQFQLGLVPKAMSGEYMKDIFITKEHGGEGFVLHIQEVGLAKPAVINALLKLRGEHGHVAESIQVWEDGGRTVHAGPKFFWIMTTNPPEDYLDRSPVDPSLARGVIYLRLGDLAKESIDMAARKICTYSVGNKISEEQLVGKYLLTDNIKIGKEVAEILSIFHTSYRAETDKGEINREQKIPATLDDISRVAETIALSQVHDVGNGRIDLAKTLKRAIERVYIKRLADPELKKRLTDLLVDTLSGPTGKKDIGSGVLATRAEILERLVEETPQKEDKPKIASAAKIKIESDVKVAMGGLEKLIGDAGLSLDQKS